MFRGGGGGVREVMFGAMAGLDSALVLNHDTGAGVMDGACGAKLVLRTACECKSPYLPLS